MSEGNFSRRGKRSATNEGDGRCGMMGAAKGAVMDDVLGETTKGVDLGDGDFFVVRGFREEVEGGFGEHGLAGARWTRDEDVVTAGDGDGDGALGLLLTVDVVEDNGGSDYCWAFGGDVGWGNFGFAFEVEEKRFEIGNTYEIDVGDQGGLGEIGLGEVDFGDASVFGGFDDVDDTADGTELAGEGEFADEELVVEIGLEELIG